jgi:transposase
MSAIPRRSVMAPHWVNGLARSRRGDGVPALALVKQTEPSLRKSVHRTEVDAGQRSGLGTQASAEIRKLRAENRELRRSHEIVRAAAGFFAAELDRPQR